MTSRKIENGKGRTSDEGESCSREFDEKHFAYYTKNYKKINKYIEKDSRNERNKRHFSNDREKDKWKNKEVEEVFYVFENMSFCKIVWICL